MRRFRRVPVTGSPDGRKELTFLLTKRVGDPALFVSGAGLNMPKSSNQKLKLLYLLRILQKETDEEHYLNSQQLIERLEKYDISAERKAFMMILRV